MMVYVVAVALSLHLFADFFRMIRTRDLPQICVIPLLATVGASITVGRFVVFQVGPLAFEPLTWAALIVSFLHARRFALRYVDAAVESVCVRGAVADQRE